jgi:phage virion morphogenesis protein
MADFINATIDDREFENLIKAMNYQGIHLKPVLAAVGNLVVKSVKRNFIEGGRPDRWKPSNKPKGKTLIGTGALMKSIHYKVDDDESGVTVMTGPQKYAAIHQFGGKTEPHEIKAKNRRALQFNVGGVTIFRKKVNHPGSNIPARPYMLLQDEDIEVIKNMMLQHIAAKAFEDSLK